LQIDLEIDLARSGLRHFRRAVAGARIKTSRRARHARPLLQLSVGGLAQGRLRCGGAWQTLKSDVEDIKSFDETPATMLHLVMRKG